MESYSCYHIETSEPQTDGSGAELQVGDSACQMLVSGLGSCYVAWRRFKPGSAARLWGLHMRGSTWKISEVKWEALGIETQKAVAQGKHWL